MYKELPRRGLARTSLKNEMGFVSFDDVLGVVGDEVRLALRTSCVSLPSREGSDSGCHMSGCSACRISFWDKTVLRLEWESRRKQGRWAGDGTGVLAELLAFCSVPCDLFKASPNWVSPFKKVNMICRAHSQRTVYPFLFMGYPEGTPWKTSSCFKIPPFQTLPSCV